MTRDGSIRVGIVGVGTIAGAIVEALCTGPHAANIEFVLGPRSPGRAADLAARFPRVRVAVSNQDVVDASEVVVLSVLPGQFEQVCAGLCFRADQVIASLVAGWPPSRLAAAIAPAVSCAQLVPLPMIALHRGPIVMYPGVPLLRRLFDGCGELVEPADEVQLQALAIGSASMSTFFALQSAIAEWIAEHGVERAVAQAYVASLFDGMAAESLQLDANSDLRSMISEHETPGGLNEQVRTALEAAGTFTELHAQFSHLLRTRYAKH